MNTDTPADLRLECRPGKEGGKLTFPYTLHNQTTANVYVMDCLPRVDAGSGAIQPIPLPAVVLHGPGDDATVGKFIAPMPTDRRVAVQVIPLARYLPAGGTLEGRLEIAAPLAETSPYFPDLPLRQYEVVEIHGLVFAIGYWLGGTSGLAALPIDGAPDLFTVTARNTIRSARLISQRFSVRSLELFRRTDEFPRNLSAEPESIGILGDSAMDGRSGSDRAR